MAATTAPAAATRLAPLTMLRGPAAIGMEVVDWAGRVTVGEGTTMAKVELKVGSGPAVMS